MNLSQKLLDIRKTTEYIQKTEKGNQGAMYVDPAVLLKKIRDKMNTHGVLLFPSLNDSKIEVIDSPTSKNPNNKGFLFSSGAKYTFIDADNPDDKLCVDWFMTGSHLQDPAMAEGGALTYSERYFLLKFFQIPTSKDDPEYFENKTREPDPPACITETQAKEIEALIKETDSDEEKFLIWAKAKTISDIQNFQYPTAISLLKAKVKNDCNRK